MNKKNKKSFELIKEIIESPKLNEALNSTEQEQLETEIYRIAIDNELQEKILADKNKWIVELLNEIEELRKIIKNSISKDKIEKELLEPINKERQEIHKEFMEKCKEDYYGAEGSILQELNWIVGTIDELLEEK